jgi:histidinol dehydrogenase
MKVTRFDWDGSDPRGQAAEIRALQPDLGEVRSDVSEIIEEVRSGGDAALLRIAERLGEKPAHGLRVPEEQIRDASARVSVDDLRAAAQNVRTVAEAEAPREATVSLTQGHSVALREVPVASAAVYAPGGTAAYPSSVIMGCVPAKVAGVERVALITPPNEDGEVEDIVLAAAEIAGADEVYAIGGAQGIAALAIGTETIDPVDVIAGPGNRYSQEAKRQLFGEVGIDGIAGPSELMAILDDSTNLDWLALDLCAQAEHSDEGLLVAVSSDPELLSRLERSSVDAARERGIGEAPLALVTAPSIEAAVGLANAVAPEHLQLACEGAEGVAESVRTAGCVFVGELSATAFGDYAAGSNHILPTGGAGRYTGPLSSSAFRRQVESVTLTEQAARELAPTVATLARAEGFPVHAESAEARAEGST